MVLLTNEFLPDPQTQIVDETRPDDTSDNLLLRLRRQNSALERLRAALDRETVEIEFTDAKSERARLG